MHSAIQLFSQTIRGLWRRRGYSITCIAILSLGIGATTTMFTLINSLLFRPLPFPDAGRLMILYSTSKDPSGKIEDFGASPTDVLDWQDRNRSFLSIGAMQGEEVGVTNTSAPEQLNAGRATAGLFQTLNRKPLLGRYFSTADEGAGNTVILSFDLWKRRFHGDRSVIERAIFLDNKGYQIIGVMPADFYFATATDLWLPLDLSGARTPRQLTRNLYVAGRLKPGITSQEASADLQNVATVLAKEFPESNEGWGARIAALREQRVAAIRPMLNILMIAVIFLLLLTCANVGNLVLTRTIENESEIALRMVLGADKRQLLREPLVESLVLSLSGGIAGLLLACTFLKPLIALSPTVASNPDGARILNDIRLDYRVFLFTFLLALLTAVLSVILPQLKGLPRELVTHLKDHAKRASYGNRGRSIQNLLAVSELTIAFVLLIGAAMMWKSFDHLRKVNLGFETRNLMTLKITLPDSRYENHQKRAQFVIDSLSFIKNIPGVESVAATSRLPLNEFAFTTSFLVEGMTQTSNADVPSANFRRLSPGYFQTIGVQLIEGRDFTAADTPDSEPVAIVSREMARHFWPQSDAIGKRIQRQARTDRVWRKVIGVVSDVKDSSLSAEAAPTLYIPYLQAGMPTFFFTIRSRLPQRILLQSVQRKLAGLDKDLPISEVKMMSDVFSDALSSPRFAMYLFVLFAASGLLLAAIGVYGVIAYHTAQRTAEIAIRMAIGAQRRSVVRLVLRRAFRIAGGATVIGILISITLTYFARSLIFGVSIANPLIYFAVTALLLLLTGAAAFFPARKASRLEPLQALRGC